MVLLLEESLITRKNGRNNEQKRGIGLASEASQDQWQPSVSLCLSEVNAARVTQKALADVTTFGVRLVRSQHT